MHRPFPSARNSKPPVITLDVGTHQPELWIFGYGSLIWNPGFKYAETMKGFARGYARRFYQGNTQHRGDLTMPGRVATLVEDEKSHVAGVLYKVRGLKAVSRALRHLHEREVLNGYEFVVVPISFNICCPGNTTVAALTCIAREENQFYLGPGVSTEHMASEIHKASGAAGPCHEYLFKLAEHCRALFPDVIDEHLFALERRVKELFTATAGEFTVTSA